MTKFIALLLLSATAQADLLYNPMEDRYEVVADRNAKLTYDADNSEFNYSDSSVKKDRTYNSHQNSYRYEKPNAKVEYNPFSKQFEYEK